MKYQIDQSIKIENTSEPVISFSEVGKSSPAHKGAYMALKTKQSNILVSAAVVLKYYEKINKK